MNINELQVGDRVTHAWATVETGTVIDLRSGLIGAVRVAWDHNPTDTRTHSAEYLTKVGTAKATRTETTWESVSRNFHIAVGDTVKLRLDYTDAAPTTRGTVTKVRGYSFDVAVDGLLRPLRVTFNTNITDAFHVASIEKKVTREIEVNLPTVPGLYVSPAFTVFQLRDNGQWWNPASNQQVNIDRILEAKHQPLNKVVSA